MPSVDVSWLAIIVATVVNMVVGFVWYGKGLFGKEWARLTGRKMEEMGSGGTGYVVTTVGALISNWILAHFLVYAGSTTFMKGAVTAFWLWLGFTAFTMAVNLVFEGRSWMLWKINAGYFLVVMLINGGLLAAWH